MAKRPHNQLDETIHQRTRLAIMASLAGVESLEFTELRSTLGVTDGNLSTHLSHLEKAGYVTITKQFVGKKPRTSVRISAKGRRAMRNYIELLQQVLEGGGQ